MNIDCGLIKFKNVLNCKRFMSKNIRSDNVRNIIELFDIVKSDSDIEKYFEVATSLLISERRLDADTRNSQLNKMRVNYFNSK
jgi:hypothetical protein